MPPWREQPLKTLLFGVVVLLFMYLTSTGVYSWLSTNWDTAPERDEHLSPLADKSRFNILLMAVDARPGETDARTDSLILANVDKQAQMAYLLSIPRDTRVMIDGHGVDKINAAHMHGGIPLTIKTVEQLTGQQINFYMKTNFDGFKEIVDTLGGIEIDVEKNMYHNEGDPGDFINLKKGKQRLNGEQALQYVRFRSDELGDISRTQRQQKFLQALATQAFRVNTVWKLPALIPQLAKTVETNFDAGDLLALTMAFSNFSNEHLLVHTLPGNFVTLHGISYWYVQPTRIPLAVSQFFGGQTDIPLIDESILVQSDRSLVKNKEEVAKPAEQDGTSDQINQTADANKATEFGQAIDSVDKTTNSLNEIDPARKTPEISKTPEDNRSTTSSFNGQTSSSDTTKIKETEHEVQQSTLLDPRASGRIIPGAPSQDGNHLETTGNTPNDIEKK
ncbi:LCP family protein [Heliophilum fasciatum]|uniref:LCP family protein n=1 Tax=Heliophilum fasciatum TaxID=35700 RepID=UPI001A9C07AA|nr:LCP family protein [Heliophilum fasciatum]